MKRRTFLKLSAGAATAGAAALALNAEWLFKGTNQMLTGAMTVPQNPKQVFSHCGACSNTMFTILNKEFGYPKDAEELASDPLAGGLMNTQHQCGMLWGSTLATGAEAFRRYQNHDQAVTAAMTGAQQIVSSFYRRTKTVNCRDVVGIDIAKKAEIAEFMLKSLPGGFANMVCMNLAEKWTPEVIEAAKQGLSEEPAEFPETALSCASEVARKMGGGEEEIVMVAGFAGGIGLSGHGCGALGAAIWMSSLDWCRKNPGESGYSNPHSAEILKAFRAATDSEMLCSKLSGQEFNSIAEHTEYIEKGGCTELIELLSKV